MNNGDREKKLRQKFSDMTMIENELYKSGYSFIAGVDEVGRGPLAGPVVAATVVLPKGFDVLGIDDSKKLSPRKRDEMFAVINASAIAVGISFISHRTVDEINILNATKKAMEESFHSAERSCIKHCRDGIDFLLTDAVHLNQLTVKQNNIVKGDEKSISIAAASIIAKVSRDRYMTEMDDRYPGYDFASNKGYGTKKHYEGIKKMGLTPIHRRSFLKDYI